MPAPQRRMLPSPLEMLDPKSATIGPISPREHQILEAVGHGWSTEEISEQLGISDHTTRTHIKNGCRKLDVKSRAHAAALVARGVVRVHRQKAAGSVAVPVSQLTEILKETRSLQGQLEEVRRMLSGHAAQSVVYGIAEEGMPEATIFRLASEHAIELDNDDAVYWRGSQTIAHIAQQLDPGLGPVTVDLDQDPIQWADETGRS